MKHEEITGLMRSLAPTIGEFVSKAMAPLRAENERLSTSLAAVEQRFADFSSTRESDKVFILTLVKEEVAKVELPVVSLDPVEIERVVSEKVEKAVAAFPVPVNGKDAEPIDLDEVASRAAKLVPVPENGKDASPESIKAAVLDVVAEVLPGEVASAVEKIEKPKDGKDADPVDPSVVANLLVDLMPVPKDGKDGVDGKSVTLDEVAPIIEGAVALEFAKVVIPEGPQGEAGKSVEIAELIPVVIAEVEKAFAGIAPPKDGESGAPGVDGKSITVDDVRPLLQEMVSEIEPAKNGKDADPAEVAALIIQDVVKLIPVPENGKSVSLDDVAPLIEDAVSKKLPSSFLVNEAGVLVAVYQNGEPKSVGKVRGEDGLRGASVMDGKVDEDGTLVLRMSDGRIIQTGRVKGEDGKDGVGQKGDRGRDAHEIQILSGVDEYKSYVEGVVALWRGGVIRAERQTDPIIDGDVIAAGWKVFVRGIAEEHEDYVDDGRFIEKTTVFTDGTEFKRRHKTVTPIYQGVWKDEASYSKGDEITWAGSSFIAMRDNQSEKPEITDAWKLKTKRGRDGKDGKGPPTPIQPVKAR